MKIDKLSDQWLFQSHSKDEIRKWIQGLKYGFFKRAWGGHANDGDSFEIWLKYDSKSELFEILERLRIKLNEIPVDYPRPIPGKSYQWKEFQKFKNEIKDLSNYEQPTHINIDGIPCFCWIENRQITFSFSGAEDDNRYEVTDADFKNCQALERIIDENGLKDFVTRDYENRITCISKKVYPELFE